MSSNSHFSSSFTEIDRVIDGESARLYEFRGVVAQLDRPHSNWPTVTVSNPVKVLNSSGDCIGHAAVHKEGSRLIGQFFLDYATPERLNIQTGERKMWAFPLFKVNHVENSMEVLDIQILGYRPSDRDLPALGEPLL